MAEYIMRKNAIIHLKNTIILFTRFLQDLKVEWGRVVGDGMTEAQPALVELLDKSDEFNDAVYSASQTYYGEEGLEILDDSALREMLIMCRELGKKYHLAYEENGVLAIPTGELQVADIISNTFPSPNFPPGSYRNRTHLTYLEQETIPEIIDGDAEIIDDENQNIVSNDSTALVFGRVTMQKAFNSYWGPCFFRALLGIAETRAKRNFSITELQTARDEMRKAGLITGQFDEVQGVSVMDLIIDYGLGILHHAEKSNHVGSHISINEIPNNVHATIIFTPRNTYDSIHFAEGDAHGNLVFDPLGGNTFEGAIITRIESFRFTPLVEDKL